MFMQSKQWRTERGQTNRHTDTRHMDRQKVKTEGLMILSNDIFYFKTVIIGGPKNVLDRDYRVVHRILSNWRHKFSKFQQISYNVMFLKGKRT